MPRVASGEAFGRGRTSAVRARVGDGSTPIATAWAPLEHQRSLVAIDRGVILAVGAPGSGKSEPGAFKLCQWALRHPRRKDGRPSKWYAIGPDFSLLRREQFGKVLAHLDRLAGPRVVKRVVGGQDPRIVLVHGQEIVGRSASEPDRLRGHEIDGFWLDEAQRQADDKAFQVALSRLRSAAEIRAVITATAEETPGWIWRLLEGEDAETRALRLAVGFYGHRWTIWQNKSNNPAVTAAIVANMAASSGDPQAVMREARALFPGTREAPLVGALNVKRGFVGRIALSDRDASPAVLGVDLGESGDFCWLTVLSLGGVVLAMDRFNADNPEAPPVGAGYWSWVEERVRAFAERWHVGLVVIDAAHAGAGMVDGYAEDVRPIRGARVERFATSGPGNRSAIIEAAALALEKGDLRVPEAWTAGEGREVEVDWVGYLAKEWSSLRPKESNGKRTWPPKDERREKARGKDDGVISLSLAWRGLRASPRPAEPVEPEDWDLSAFDSLGSRRF